MLNGFVESPRRILFVSDNPADAAMLREGFRQAGATDELIVAENDGQAMEACFARARYAGAHPPDLVVIDSSLWNGQAFAVLRAMKEEPSLRSIPVVILASGGVTEDDIGRMYDMYCNCVIRKPIDLQGYLEMSREVATFWLKVVRLPHAAELDR